MVNDRGITVFLWTPGVTAGEIGVASEIVPFSLNQTMMSTAPNTDQIINPFTAENFQATSVGLSGGHYTLTFVTSGAANASSSVVPEPETYAMLLAGLWSVKRYGAS